MFNVSGVQLTLSRLDILSNHGHALFNTDSEFDSESESNAVSSYERQIIHCKLSSETGLESLAIKCPVNSQAANTSPVLITSTHDNIFFKGIFQQQKGKGDLIL